MYRNMAQLYRNNQIIDVTKECTFEWYQEPSSCYAFLEVSGASGDFTDGETVTGQTSGATATVFSSYVDGGRVYVTDVNGTFQENETIEGGLSHQTATVDRFVGERSYPDNIIKGTFPDSIINRDLNDYLEWESTLPGANYAGYFNIYLPSDGIYSFTWLCGVGVKVDSIVCTREFRWRTGFTFSPIIPFGETSLSTDFDKYIANNSCPSMVYLKSNQFMRPMFRQMDKGTFRWRVYFVRVFKIII